MTVDHILKVAMLNDNIIIVGLRKSHLQVHTNFYVQLLHKRLYNRCQPYNQFSLKFNINNKVTHPNVTCHGFPRECNGEKS